MSAQRAASAGRSWTVCPLLRMIRRWGSSPSERASPSDRTEHTEHTESVLSEGTVREWSDDHGWGVIDSADTPGGCWVHFSMIVADGLASLQPGDHVTFTYETPGQEGFDYRAVMVWPPGTRPETPQQPSRGGSSAYRSSLTIRWPDGSFARGVPGRQPDK